MTIDAAMRYTTTPAQPDIDDADTQVRRTQTQK
jgi:hypothetical protein